MDVRGGVEVPDAGGVTFLEWIDHAYLYVERFAVLKDHAATLNAMHKHA